MTKDTKSSSNVRRAAEILVALGGASPSGLTPSELAVQIGDTRSAIHRALAGLAQYGLVDQNGRRSTYRIGPAFYALANKSHNIADLVNFYRPILIGISADTGLSSYLMVRAGLDSICIDVEAGSAPVQALFDGIGGRLPLGVGLGGVTILAQMDKRARDKIIEVNAPRYRRWDVDAHTIREEIERLQANGFVIGHRDSNRDLFTMAFPAHKAGLYNSLAAISLLGPRHFVKEDAVPSIVKTAQLYLDESRQAERAPPTRMRGFA